MNSEVHEILNHALAQAEARREGRRKRARRLILVSAAALVGLSVAVSILFGPVSILPVTGGVLLYAWGFAWPLLYAVSLLFPRKRLLASDAADEDAEQPLITILAPARNEEPVAEKLVQTYLDQDYGNWQLLVIANNCTDDTAGVARRAAGGDSRVEILEATFENGVKSDALNFAVPYAKGDVILEMDADNMLPQGYLRAIADAFRDPHVQAVQTQIRAVNGRDNLLAAWQDIEFLVYSEVWNRARTVMGLAASIGGTGFAIRPAALNVVGGWSRDLVEDYELHTRLVEAGIHVDYLGEATIYDEKPVTWDALLRQRKRWIRGHIEVATRRARSEDRLGLIDELYLYSPVFVVISLMMFVLGYTGMLFPGFVGDYIYFSPWIWFYSLVFTLIATLLVVARARAWNLIPLVAPYLAYFTFHWIVILFSSLTPVGWSGTKTVHGVTAKKGVMPWLGLDSPASARFAAMVAIIAVGWLGPLFFGVRHVPTLLSAPILYANGTTVIASADAACVERGEVQGIVHDNRGRPIDGATVELESTTGIILRTTSSDDGRFILGNVVAGLTYEIRVTCVGFDQGATSFEMPSDSGVWVDATLAVRGSGAVVVPFPY